MSAFVLSVAVSASVWWWYFEVKAIAKAKQIGVTNSWLLKRQLFLSLATTLLTVFAGVYLILKG